MFESVEYLKSLPYSQYLQSQWWASRRRRAVRTVGFRCERCGFRHELEVHHKSYENLGDERDTDLEVLCARCHNDEHIELLKEKIGQPSEREILRSIMITKEDYEKRKSDPIVGVMA